MTTTEFLIRAYNKIYNYMQTIDKPIYLKTILSGTASGIFVGIVLYRICYLLASM